MSSTSISNTRLVLEIGDKMQLVCDLKRHLSPRTVGLILRSLPFEANAHRLDGIVYVETIVESGIERSRKEFKAGDVAFLPTGRSICFFTKSVTSSKAMSPIGKLSGDLSVFDKIKPGDVISIHADG